MFFVRLLAASLCALLLSSCSNAHGSNAVASRPADVSRPIPGAHVVLAPTLEGGVAGLSMAVTYTAGRRGRAAAGSVSRGLTTTGPIFDEGCYGAETTYVAVLTRGDVADVSVAGGAPIPTESNSTLPNGLRGVAIELPSYRIVFPPPGTGYPWSPCPRVGGFAANGKPIDERGTIGKPLNVELPRRHWKAPARPASGVCALTATRLPRETRVLEGTMATRLGALLALAAHAFISCAETKYIYMGEHELPAAVLLNAVHPGVEPPGLPGMEPLADHPGVYEVAPGMFARRIRGAWLAVQERERIGPSVPLELLEHLRATVHFADHQS